MLTSKTLNRPARADIKEAGRLDAKEARQRELDQRTKQTADIRASEKARAANKAAFRPLGSGNKAVTSEDER